MRFMGVVVEAGQPRVVFSRDDLDFPCVGFTRDGRFLVGVDAFNGVTLFRWPDFAYDATAAHPEGHEGRFDAMILDGHVVTERHAEDTTESSLLVLSLPTLAEEAQIAWSERGAFAKPDDDFGLDMAAAVGSDAFLEVTNDPTDTSAWTCRIWRLSVGD